MQFHYSGRQFEQEKSAAKNKVEFECVAASNTLAEIPREAVGLKNSRGEVVKDEVYAFVGICDTHRGS